MIVHYDYSEAELAFLLAHDGDPFNRWEAGQQLIVRAIIANMTKVDGKPTDTALLDSSLLSALGDPRLDDGMRNQLLVLPSRVS